MGRGNALPQRFFGALSPKTSIPRNNVLLVGAITLLGVFLLTYERGAELVNFGAFIAFMGVNAAALIHYRFRSTEKVLLPMAIPLAGLIVSAFIWINPLPQRTDPRLRLDSLRPRALLAPPRYPH